MKYDRKQSEYFLVFFNMKSENHVINIYDAFENFQEIKSEDGNIKYL